MKKCGMCKLYKDFACFSKDKSRKHGLKNRCKDCAKIEFNNYFKNNSDDIRIRNANWRKNNREKSNKSSYDYRKKNLEKTKQRQSEYRKNNKEKEQIRHRIYRENNLEKEKLKISNWQKNNPDKVNAKTAKRTSKRLKACPKWLTEDHIKEILNFYTLAKELTKQTGLAHEVDHILPLQGKNISGLHVPWNLQVLPRSINRSKGNKIIFIKEDGK